MYFEVFV